MSAAGFDDLARSYAERGDLRLAQLATWAADVHVLEELLWENGVGQAPDPGAQLAAVGESVAASLALAAQSLPAGSLTPRALLETAREAMVTTFDESVHGLLADRFGALDHLDATPPEPDADGPAGEPTAGRLAGRTPDELAADLWTAATDCAAIAVVLQAGGEVAAAERLVRQAEAATFEAHLVRAAIRGGDDALATVDLRWDLAVTADDDRSPRDRFAGAVGTAERDTLHRMLEQVDAP